VDFVHITLGIFLLVSVLTICAFGGFTIAFVCYGSKFAGKLVGMISTV